MAKALEGLEDTKSLKICSGSFGLFDEHSEAGLLSSCGGLTNPLLNIANIVYKSPDNKKIKTQNE